MRVLIVGAGAREHAIAWQLARSQSVTQLWVAPGNGGTAALQPLNRSESLLARLGSPVSPAPEPTNVGIAADDIPGLARFAREHAADLVVVGPEVPLALGLVDALAEAGIRAFGPTRDAARLESSKAWAKDFMARHGIPTARYAAFSEFDAALKHLLGVDYDVVLKADGLAAGKGVLIPSCADEAEAALRRILLDREFGPAGNAVVIEERLQGEEVSLMAFVDGETIAPMLPAQDHKRLLDGDAGPNTGGMGAICPAPNCPPGMIEEINRTILAPTLAGLRADGIVYRGVLYAGLMLTRNGPMVLEYNCRFGDPETECVLPLLQTDLYDVCAACATGTLASVPIRWRPGACATIVLASGGYPGAYQKGLPITGVEDADEQPDCVVFHAGTRRAGDALLTDGGRVLAVTALGDTLDAALRWAYTNLPHIRFDGMHFRREIGRAHV